MGGCGFWFVLYMLLVGFIAMTLHIENVWLLLPVCIFSIFVVGFIRALLIQAYDENTGCGGLFRVVVLLVLFALLGAHQGVWALLLFGIYCFLELVVAFSR